ncbi:MAG: hypothetical protein ACRDT2_00395 [Natronosporangium sp.]
MTTPEWLRPVSERFLGGPTGPPPWTVRVAAGLCALCALAAAWMVVTFGPMTVQIGQNPLGRVPWLNVLLAALTAATGAVLLVVFALSTVLLFRRGWFRPPVMAGLVLGILAGLGLCAAAAPATMMLTGEEPDLQWRTAAFVTPRLMAAAVLGFGLVLTLRTGSASGWLAKRRYQALQARVRTRPAG